MESAPNNRTKSFPGQSGEESLSAFPSIQKEKGLNIGKEADIFKEAQEGVVSEKMFKLFLRAITEKETTRSNDTLTLLRNRIIQECVNLSEKNLELILNQFNNSFHKWFSDKIKPSDTDSRVYQSIISGKYTHDIHNNVDFRGTQSVISFLKARSKLLDISPVQQYSFYFNNKLDSRYSIDVIEEIEDGSEPTISLIQLKSKEPSEEEKSKIYSAHKEWVESQWLNFRDYENSYIEEGTEAEIGAFLSNKEKVEEALFEFCTNPEGQDLQKLVESLRLSDLNNRQQAWVLYKYIDLLNEQLSEAVKDGMLDGETKEQYAKELLELKDRLVKKVRLPESVVLVKKIKSVIAVGSKTVFEKEIDTQGEGRIMSIR